MMNHIKKCALIVTIVLLYSCSTQSVRGEVGSALVPVKDAKYVHHIVYLPKECKTVEPEKRELGNNDIRIDLYARKFAQGNAIYMEVRSREGGEALFSVDEATFGSVKLMLVKKPWGYRALIPVHVEHKTGKVTLQLRYSLHGQKKAMAGDVAIEKTDFPCSKTPLDLGKFSRVDVPLRPETVLYMKECVEKKRKAFSTVSPDYLGEATSYPRDKYHITSSFWMKRIYMQYRYKGRRKISVGSRESTHGGVDLRGNLGEPVFALADGKIALADKLYYEGNFVVIDHGNRIFSYYMHMSKLTVEEGDIIHAGEQIGLVGSTGISTGSHLHVSLIIMGIQVDPLSLIPLPLKN